MIRPLSAAALLLGAGPALAADDLMVVFDGSNSMWGQIDGTAKVTIAREAVGALADSLPADLNVGLMAYGHRRRGDCGDIETVLPVGPFDREAFLIGVASVQPTGKTPLTEAVRQAAETLSYRDRPATVVLISDGLESCGKDPCALAAELERSGVGFTAHVVGFGLGAEEDTSSLACIAEETGGRFLAAADAATLTEALGTVGETVAAAPEPEPEPVVEPEPEPAPEPAITFEGPETAVAGSEITVAWSETLDPRDFITVQPLGAEDREINPHIRTRNGTEARLRMPGVAGLYELRYVLEDGRVVAGRRAIELTEPDVSVSGPATALAGAEVSLSWTGTVHAQDFITIQPLDADEREVNPHFRVRDKNEGRLKAPGTPGLYEVRYVLDSGRRVVARQPIELTDAEVSISGPATALAGSEIEVTWSGTVSGQDFITIQPLDAPERDVSTHIRARDKSTGKLRVPAAPGLYELRYVLEEGRRVLARAPLEATAAEVTVSAPASGLAGGFVEVAWTGAVDGRDFVTIQPMDADERKVDGRHIRVRGNSEGRLKLPGTPGLYEVRYVLDKDRMVMARQVIEALEAEVTVTGPAEVRAGDQLPVSWTGTVAGDDFIALVPADAEARQVNPHIRPREKAEGKLRAPKAPGLYEIRYVLSDGKRVLARAPVEVLPADAQLSTGARIEAPATAAPGSEIEVAYTLEGDGGDRRLTLAKKDQAVFTWISATKIEGPGPMTVTAPSEPGEYEIRILDIGAREVLTRAVVRVE